MQGPCVALVPCQDGHRLFKITAVFEFAYTKDIRAALIGEYGEPDHEHAENWTWDNGVSAIQLTQGNDKSRTTLTFIDHELNEMTEVREPGPAADEL